MLRLAAIFIACVAILSYTVFHIVSLFSGELSTVVVGITTEERSIGFDGYIFRDETVIYSSYGGAVDYVAHDGLKVSAKDTLAYVYEHGNNRNVSERIEQIDREIAVISEAINSGDSLTDLPKLNESAGVTHGDIMKKLSDGDLGGINKSIDSMTSELGKVSLVTNERSPLRTTLESLYAERERIIAAGGGKQEIRSDKSGYFYSKTDGYEGIFSIEAADSMTPDGYFEYASAKPADMASSNAVGKMTYSTEWKFVCTLDKDEAENFSEGETYRLTFKDNNDVTFPLTLSRKTADDDSRSVLLVFDCDRAPTTFSFDRYQSVEAVIESISGINVPKSAVHKNNGELCVYILKGSVVFERRIKVLYEGSDHYTVADGAYIDYEDGLPYLKGNDTLILNGKNLFDGRILE